MRYRDGTFPILHGEGPAPCLIPHIRPMLRATAGIVLLNAHFFDAPGFLSGIGAKSCGLMGESSEFRNLLKRFTLHVNTRRRNSGAPYLSRISKENDVTLTLVPTKISEILVMLELGEKRSILLVANCGTAP